MQSTVSEPQVLSVNGILDTSFRLYRKHFWTYLAIILIIEIPLSILFGILVSTSDIRLTTFQVLFFVARFEITLFFIIDQINVLQPLHIFSLLGGAFILQMRIVMLINTTTQIYHTGRASIVQAYRIPIIRIGVIGLFGFIATILFDTVSNGFIRVIGVFGLGLFRNTLLFLTLLFTIPFICVYQIIMLENPNPFAAIVRNWYLIRGSVLRIIGLLLLLFILDQVFYAMPTFILTYAWIYTGLGDILTWTRVILGYIISLLLMSFSTVVFTLLYFELRVRREGYDLELKTQQHFANN